MISALCPPLNLLFSSLEQTLRFPVPSPPRTMPPFVAPDPILHEFRFFHVYESGRVEKLHPPTHAVPPSSSSDGLISRRTLSSPPTHLSPPDCSSRPAPTGANVGKVFVGVCCRGQRRRITLYADLGKVFVAKDSAGRKISHEKVFVAGDSAGGNISHHLAVRIGESGLRIEGAVLSHPFFGGTEDDAMWLYMCPENDGLHDRRLRPQAEDLRKVGCRRMLVFVAEKDHLRAGGERYVDELRKS